MLDNPKSKASKRTVVILLSIGLTAGVLGGLLGIGGGALIVPALVFFLAFDQHRAHGTSLAVVLALSLSSVITYSCHHRVDLLLAGEIAVGGVVGAVIGGNVVQRIKSKALRTMFSIFLVAAGLKMGLDGYKMVHAAHLAGSQAAQAVVPMSICLGSSLLAIGTGVVTGFVSSLLGVGGGIVMVPMLTMVLMLPQQAAQGVSLAAMMPIAFTGALKHNKLGNVDQRVALWIAMGAVVGAVAGSTLANVLQPGHLKLIFGGFIIVMAALMAAKRK